MYFVLVEHSFVISCSDIGYFSGEEMYTGTKLHCMNIREKLLSHFQRANALSALSS